MAALSPCVATECIVLLAAAWQWLAVPGGAPPAPVPGAVAHSFVFPPQASFVGWVLSDSPPLFT